MALLTVVALVPVAVLAASSIVLASNQVRSVVDRQVQTTAAVSSNVIGQRTTDLVALVHSYTSRRSLILALSGRTGDTTIDQNLASLAAATPGISAAFVADLGGTSRNTFPIFPGAIGTNFAYREWYKGLVASGRPYVSSAIVTKEASHTLAVTVTDYIRSFDGRPIGILGVNYSLQSIGSFAANVGKAQGITLQLTDRLGTSLTSKGVPGLVSLAADPRVKAALAGHKGLLEYAPVGADGGRGRTELSAYAPVAATGWTVIASIPKAVAYAGLVRLRNTVLAITAVLVLVLLAGVGTIARAGRRRRESELRAQSRDRELARLLDSTDEGFVSIDPAGLITGWNARAEHLYGWTAAEVIGQSMLETLVPPADRDLIRDDLVSYHAGTGSFMVGKRVEMRVLHRDGHEIDVEVGVWAHDGDTGMSALVHDIGDRVAARVELEEARDEAMQTSRLKSEFLANMSHEIRTPMNGVVGMSGLLLNTELDALQRDYAETVCSSAEALLTVIDDILDFSKIEAGKLDVESVTFDLRSVVEQSAVLLAARAHQDGLELTCWIDPSLPTALKGDPGRLRQVLLNLLGNAVKFTSDGEVNLIARLAGEDDAGVVTVELSVRDTGIGIAAPSLEHLFDAFTQADSSTSRRYGGTGLGLAISRQLVELMGGTLDVVSELGVGSTFSVLIPFPPGIAEASDTNRAELTGVRVLIVDDNVTNQRVLQEMVAWWGCSAAFTGGAELAIALLREAVAKDRLFDVILLDLNMPDIDGYGLARMVRADPRLAHTPMIMLTSSARRGEALRTQQAGVMGYLTKPVRAAQLRIALDGALRPTHAVSRSLVPHQAADPAGGTPIVTDEAQVLLVEDDIVNQKVLTAQLARIGYRADIAENGFDALELLSRKRYAAVFMDCQMPLMDGYETTEKLRQREGTCRHTCVIALTASAMAEDRDRCLAAGMDDYLTKPVKADDLAAKLAHWLDRDAHQPRPSAEIAPRQPSS